MRLTKIFYFTVFMTSILTYSCGNQENENINDKNNMVTEVKETIDSTIVDSITDISSSTDTISVKNPSITKEIVKQPISPQNKTSITNIITDQKQIVGTPIDQKNIKVVEVKEDVKIEQPEEFNHQIWDNLLKKYVTSSGKVNYKGFKSEKEELEKYIRQLQGHYSELKSWGKNKQLAYWINVYNAYTVKLIVDNYPVKSIQDINGGKPWDKKFIFLGDETFSLNNVENDIIRPRYKERRIHFAVNCASISCPKLLNQAYTEANLNSKLTQQTKDFLANTSQNVLDKKKIKISKIFEWYKTDFTSSDDIIPFIKEYTSVEIDDNAKVEYLEYNWNLNE